MNAERSNRLEFDGTAALVSAIRGASNIEPAPTRALARAPLAAEPARERRRLARRFAAVLYRIARPVVRPVAWRSRSFLVQPVQEGLAEQRLALAGEAAGIHGQLEVMEQLVRMMIEIQHTDVAELRASIAAMAVTLEGQDWMLSQLLDEPDRAVD